MLGKARVTLAETSCPWRFAGQYWDEETGLSYNRFRYYDPDLGRYISQDPIGIEGGLGLYNYVREPWAFVDWYGLACKQHDIGRRGVAAAEAYLQSKGYTILSAIQNKSGHGIDIMARDAAGQLWAFEVKATEGLRAPALSAAQRKGAGTFVPSRLARANAARGSWKSPIGPHVSHDAGIYLGQARGIQGGVIEVFLSTGKIAQRGW